MRELNLNEIKRVYGGHGDHPPGENDDGSHSPKQRTAEQMADRLYGGEHHCVSNGEGGYSCSQV